MGGEDGGDKPSEQGGEGRVGERRVAGEGVVEEFQGEPAGGAEDNEEVEVGMM